MPALTDRWTECGRVCAIVSAAFGVPIQEMLSERRDVKCARPRMVAMYLLHRTTTFSLSRIGRAFQRDHTTIAHAVNEIAARMAADIDLRTQVTRCEDQVRNPDAMAAERVISGITYALESEIEDLAARAFARDPILAAAAIRDALRAFLARERKAA
jgi:hypothetical protein